MSAFKTSSSIPIQPSLKSDFETQKEKLIIEAAKKVVNDINSIGCLELTDYSQIFCRDIEEYICLKEFRQSKFNFKTERVKTLQGLFKKAFK